MATPIARIGDLIDHGGYVLEGSPTRKIDNIPCARIGDNVICAVHGINPIVTGSPHSSTDFRRTARIGSRTACGAIIITGSPTSKVS